MLNLLKVYRWWILNEADSTLWFRGDLETMLEVLVGVSLDSYGGFGAVYLVHSFAVVVGCILVD